MFDLEKAIADWRKQMLVAGIQSEALEELELHLREEIEELMHDGMTGARAFELAVRHVGSAAELKKEFMKTENTKWTTLLRKLKSFILGVQGVPLPDMENFEMTARQALKLAPEEARHFNHDFVGTEHLLLGLMRSGSKTVSNVMHKLGVNCEMVQREIELFVTKGLTANLRETIPYTPRARQALQLAAEEAEKLNEHQVKAEHIFLGLLREGSGVAAVVLKNLHVRLESAREEILKEMRAQPGGI